MSTWTTQLKVVSLILVLSCPVSMTQDCSACVENSMCVNNECVCTNDPSGNPNFMCKDPSIDVVIAGGNNDPVQETFMGENFVYHLIGSTRLIQLTTDNDLGGKCDFWLWGWTERFLGKFYLGGLAFRFDQLDLARNVNSSHRGTIHAVGESPASTYRWDVQMFGQEDDSEESFTITMQMSEVKTYDGCVVRFEEVSGFFLKVTIECCGIIFAIRPYHRDFPGRMSGYWSAIESSANPRYENWSEGSEPLTLDHLGMVTMKEIIARTGITSGTNIDNRGQTTGRREAGTFHAITNSFLTKYPDSPVSLGLLKSMLRNCPVAKRNDLFFNIMCLMDNPKMLKCMNGAEGKSVDTTIRALLYGIGWLCYDVVDSCVPLARMLQVPECAAVVQEFPTLVHLSDENNCPIGQLVDDFCLDYMIKYFTVIT